MLEQDRPYFFLFLSSFFSVAVLHFHALCYSSAPVQEERVILRGQRGDPALQRTAMETSTWGVGVRRALILSKPIIILYGYSRCSIPALHFHIIIVFCEFSLSEQIKWELYLKHSSTGMMLVVLKGEAEYTTAVQGTDHGLDYDLNVLHLTWWAAYIVV